LPAEKVILPEDYDINLSNLSDPPKFILNKHAIFPIEKYDSYDIERDGSHSFESNQEFIPPGFFSPNAR
jgi:hypothetical protein